MVVVKVGRMSFRYEMMVSFSGGRELVEYEIQLEKLMIRSVKNISQVLDSHKLYFYCTNLCVYQMT